MMQIVLRRGEHRARLQNVKPPKKKPNQIQLRALQTGIDGTDESLLKSGTFEPPQGKDQIVLGHEALAMVESGGSGFAAGERVVPLVRRGCRSCVACQQTAVDMCPNDDFREHGLRGLDGFMRETWWEDPGHVVRVPPGLGDVAVLTEPMSIVVKAYHQAVQFQSRLSWATSRPFHGLPCLVAGSGSLGSLASILLALEGAKVWTLDRSDEDAASSQFLRRLGAQHINSKTQDVQRVADRLDGFQLVIDTTGATPVATQLHQTLAGNGILALLGIFPRRSASGPDMGPIWSNMVMKNQIVFGSVNSNRTHFEAAFRYLRRGRKHARQAITHRFRPPQAEQAFSEESPDVIKKVIDWTGAH